MSTHKYVRPIDSPALRESDDAFLTDSTILVTGPQSSGTRLMTRILSAGGVHAIIDGWHGTVVRRVNRVVVMVRHPETTRRSRDAAFVEQDRIPRESSLAGCLTFYPDALWVSYEQLCAAPDATISVLAEWLGVPTWLMPEEIVPSIHHMSEGIAWPSS